MQKAMFLLSCLPGPFAIAGFFLPWAHGAGVLSGSEFSGFSLVRFTGDLQGLNLSVFQGAAIWLSRTAILLVPIAGVWQAILAPRWRWHLFYAASGWYLVGFVVVACVVGVVRGISPPPPGLALEILGAWCFVIPRVSGEFPGAR